VEKRGLTANNAVYGLPSLSHAINALFMQELFVARHGHGASILEFNTAIAQNLEGMGRGVNKEPFLRPRRDSDEPVKQAFTFSNGFRVGLAAHQGKRFAMEDATLVELYGEGNPLKAKDVDTFGILAIFDGHKGPAVALAAKDSITQTLVDYLDLLSADELSQPDLVRQALENAFADPEPSSDAPALESVLSASPLPLSLDQRLKNLNLEGESGSTAVVAVFLNQRIYIANLGDSRAVLITEQNEGKRLTKDHDLFDWEEEKTILRRGGNIKYNMWAKPRIRHLNMSRALGNWQIPELRRRPVITYVDLEKTKAKGLILSCDGVFEPREMNAATAAEIVVKNLDSDPLTAASELVEAALRLNSEDNLSALVVSFQLPSCH
jgi:serine/threonine protein phosphatase PrpC